MFEALAPMDVAWSEVVIYQVDERIAPVGDPTRNLTNLESQPRRAPPRRSWRWTSTSDDLDAAARATPS
jgi:6-phosphogluconolactonase